MQETKKDDLKVRVKALNDKLIPLLAEFNLALGSQAFLTKDGRIASKPSLFDNQPQKGGDIASSEPKTGTGQEAEKKVENKSDITEG